MVMFIDLMIAIRHNSLYWSTVVATAIFIVISMTSHIRSHTSFFVFTTDIRSYFFHNRPSLEASVHKVPTIQAPLNHMDSSPKTNDVIDLTLDDDDDDVAKHKMTTSKRPKVVLPLSQVFQQKTQTTFTIPTATTTSSNGDKLCEIVVLDRKKPIVFLIDGDNRGDCIKICSLYPDPIFETVVFYGPHSSQNQWSNIHVVRTNRPYRDAADYEINFRVTHWLVTKQLIGKTCFVVSADIGVWNVTEILRAQGVRSYIVKDTIPLLKILHSLRAREFKFLEDEQLVMP